MKKKIQFSLVYRDMFQSSGKYQPRKDQLERVAPASMLRARAAGEAEKRAAAEAAEADKADKAAAGEAK